MATANVRHEDQIRMGTATTLDEPVSETIVSLKPRFFQLGNLKPIAVF